MRNRKTPNLEQSFTRHQNEKTMTRQEIGELIKKELKLQDKDQKQLAEELNLDYTMINGTVNASAKWSFSTMNKILDHLKLVASLRVPIDES